MPYGYFLSSTSGLIFRSLNPSQSAASNDQKVSEPLSPVARLSFAISTRLCPSLRRVYPPSRSPSPLLSPIVHIALSLRVRRDPVTEWAVEKEGPGHVEYVNRYWGTAQLAESAHLINLNQGI